MPAFKHEHALARAREIRRVDQAVMATADQDRKSTRLNSSHSQISYAVFCLKKKKNTHSDSSFPTHSCSSTRASLTPLTPTRRCTSSTRICPLQTYPWTV